MGFIVRPAEQWAEEEFGDTYLGDARCSARLVKMARGVADKPAGKVTATMNTPADVQAAYRLLKGHGWQWGEVTRAAAEAAFRRAESSLVVVPIDQTSLTVSSAPADSDFGPVGNSNSESVGVNVMGSILVTPDGTPLGSGGQHMWVRPPKGSEERVKADIPGRGTRLPRKRPLEEKESAYWLRVGDATLGAKADAEYQGQVWFQMDRGADCHEVMAWGLANDCWVTIRASQDRVVMGADQRHLWDFMNAQSVAGAYELDVTQGPKRTARRARMEVRTGEAVIALRNRGAKKVQPGRFLAVLAREVSKVPNGEKPIEWLLITNRPGQTFEDALLVISTYAMRWRIEEVHKTWKSVTKVEESNLRTATPFQFWATILYSVAVRIERLKYLARTAPDTPASSEFTEAELMAVDALKRRAPRFVMPANPTVGQVVTFIAELGGYTGRKRSGGPPGAITLARGLDRVRPVAEALETLRSRCDQ